MSRFKQYVSDALRGLSARFAPNELAYLALTSKPEFVIRDKLAFALYNELSSEDLIVSREWKRTDLAILDAAKPLVLIELKAMYTFDVLYDVNPIHPYHDRLLKDVQKALLIARPKTKVFALLLATHPHARVDNELSGVVKYLRDVNRAYGASRDSAFIQKAASARVHSWFPQAGMVQEGKIRGGNAFGVEVDVLYWLIGPFAT